MLAVDGVELAAGFGQAQRAVVLDIHIDEPARHQLAEHAAPLAVVEIGADLVIAGAQLAGQRARTHAGFGEPARLVRDEQPRFAPGERYEYSNSGFVLLGAGGAPRWLARIAPGRAPWLDLINRNAFPDGRALAALPLGDAVVAAVPDPSPDAAELASTGVARGAYVNAGLLVMNLPVWRAEGVAERCLALLSDPARQAEKIEIDGPLILRGSARIPEGLK